MTEFYVTVETFLKLKLIFDIAVRTLLLYSHNREVIIKIIFVSFQCLKILLNHKTYLSYGKG